MDIAIIKKNFDFINNDSFNVPLPMQVLCQKIKDEIKALRANKAESKLMQTTPPKQQHEEIRKNFLTSEMLEWA